MFPELYGRRHISSPFISSSLHFTAIMSAVRISGIILIVFDVCFYMRLQTLWISVFLFILSLHYYNAYSKWVYVWVWLSVCVCVYVCWVCQAGSQRYASGRWCIQPRHWLFILLCLLLAQCYSIIIWFMDWHGVYTYPNEWLFSANADVLHVSVCVHVYLFSVCMRACVRMCVKKKLEAS